MTESRLQRWLLRVLIGLAVAAVLLLPIVGLGGGPAEEELPAVEATATGDGRADRRGPRLFAPDSVWNEPLAADAKLDRASRSIVADLAAEIEREKRLGIGPWVGTVLASTPLYVVPKDQPRVRVTVDDTGVVGAARLQRAFAAVPIPPGAKPAQGTDAHLTIYQPSTDSMWEFWKAHRRPDGWHAGWGGAMSNVADSPGYYGPHAWPGAGANWGATASSLPLIGGVMLLSELRAGRVDHALAMNIPFPRRDEYAWPAQRTDGDGPPDALPEGARLRLDPTLDLDQFGLPRFTRIVAEAAQRYGMIVRDQTHHATSLFIEDWTPHHRESPLLGPDGIYGGSTPLELLSLFPWERLQLLKMHLCRNGERCPAPGESAG
ncbi:MAG TPA: hypothetical protein VEX36_11280 [Thermoleophilaceae bacterium]|nr:hypothetical protein [Thermoleophilaceae bacterium]